MSPYDGRIVADARALPLADKCVQCCVTSPPFWGLRDYGHSEQIGLEATPDEYVDNILIAFREVWRVLKPDGTLWLNLGDCYATGAGKVGNCPGGGEQGARWRGDVDRPRDDKRGYRGERLANGHGDEPAILRKKTRATRDGSHAGKHTAMAAIGPMTQPNRMPIEGLKPKDLVGIPWRVAFALRAEGWYLRSDIIWHKPNPMPESVQDRPTSSHEYIFLLTKSDRYFYDAAAIKEVAHDTGRENGRSGRFEEASARPPNSSPRTLARIDYSQQGRNKRNVWTIATHPYPEAHYATFPPALVEPCVRAGSRVGDFVLDPFAGSGTVAMVAQRFGRLWVASDLGYQNLCRRSGSTRPVWLYMINETGTTNVDSTFNVLSLFAGFGGLDLAVRIAIPNARTVVFLEREAPAIGFLVEAMEAGILDTAPIWTDVTTFDGRALRGKVDCIIAGAPCQPYSVAGSRKGDADERYLWPAIFRIIDDVQPAMVLLENVPGLLVWFRPIGEELCRMGYRLEAGLFSAAECGAPQKRERLFILAHALRPGSSSEFAIQPNKEYRADSIGTSGGSVDDAGRSERRPDSHRSGDSGEGSDRERQETGRIAESSKGLADSERARRQASGSGQQEYAGREFEPGCGIVANTSYMRLQGRELGTTRDGNGGRQETHGSATELRDARLPIWPPGPGDSEGWRYILERWPELAPAVADSDSRRLEAVGSGGLLDREKACGNDIDGRDTEELDNSARIREHGQDRKDGSSSGRDGETGGELADAESGRFRADGRTPGKGGHTDECGANAEREEKAEFAVRGLAPGIASELAIPRMDQLRGLGNLVVPATGALALVTLMRRAGLTAPEFGQD